MDDIKSYLQVINLCYWYTNIYINDERKVINNEISILPFEKNKREYKHSGIFS